jgi:hypothetical protein
VDSPTLDPKNRSTKLLLKKGFDESFCFVTDVFPRRVALSGCKDHARKLWPDYKTNDDTLHSEYRKHGGEVTVIMGEKAIPAYEDVVTRENSCLEKLYEIKGWKVWAEMVFPYGNAKTNDTCRTSKIKFVG